MGIILFIVLWVTSASAVSAQYHPPVEQETGFEGRIMAYLELMLETEGIAGLSAGIVDHDGFSWAAGVGYADIAEQQLASQYTLYPVASLTKMVTAIAVMQLLDAGHIALEDPIADHLDAFQVKSRFPDADPIRIVHLLGHYGGVPRDIYKGLMTDDPDVRPELLDHLSRQYLAYPPEVKYLYSNIGYELLGKIIEEVSGMPFDEYIKQHVLEPMGMSDSTFDCDVMQCERFARAYVPGSEEAFHEFPHTLKASGGLYANTHEMTALLRWILAGGAKAPELPEDLVGKMFEDQKTEHTLDVGLLSGWSWVMESHPDPMEGIYAYQIGSTMHYNAVMAVAPDHHIGVVLLTNTGGVLGVLEDMARLIVLAAIQQQTGESFPEDKLVELAPETSPPDSALKAVTGSYLLQNELIVVSEVDHELIVNTGNQSFQAFYHEDGWFSISEHFRFKTRPWEDTQVLIIDRNGRVFPAGTDITDQYTIPEEAFSIAGRYKIDNVDPEVEEVVYEEAAVSLRNGIMQIEFVLNEHQQRVFGYQAANFNLIPVSGTEAIIGGFGMYKGETVYFDQEDGDRFLRFAGLRFRKAED